MMMKTEVRKIGNSLGIVLPKEAPKSALQVTPEKGSFEQKARIAEDLMQRYRNALRELAK